MTSLPCTYESLALYKLMHWGAFNLAVLADQEKNRRCVEGRIDEGKPV